MKYSRKTTNYRDITMWHSSTTPAYGHPSFQGGELILAFLLALFLNLPHLFAQSQAYHIGDVITNPDGSKGVVFWLAPDGSGGWMCALNDVSGTYQWSTQSVNISGFPALPTPSSTTWQSYATVTADTAGYSHTQRLRAAGNANTYPAAYAVDFAHGWYLPAIGQLLKLYAQQPSISAALVANGGSEISRTNSYWSSTYATTSNAYYLYNPYGYWSTTSKSTAYSVRPVRSFGIQNSNLEISYQWNTGDTTAEITVSPDTTTTYQLIATNEAGCNDTVDFTLYVNSPIPQSITETTCGSYEWNGQTYTESGTYTYAHENVHGCQQVDTLHLTVNNPVHQSDTATTCGSYEWHGQSYTESGVYTHAHEDANGCQQVDTLHLTVNNPVHQSDTATTCGSYEWHGQTYTESGVYTHAHEDANGCIQVDTLHLTVNNPVHQSDTETTCGSYEWNGQTYTESGTYTYAHENVHGCQQVDTLHLTINAVDTVRFNETVCQGESYTGHGFNIPADSTMTPHVIVETRHATSLRTGCDSCTILTLTISPAPEANIQSTADTICQGESATLSVSATSSSSTGSFTPPVIAIGDILCTDNSIVKPSDWPVAGKTAMGVVFYVDNSDQHGWAVALKEFANVTWGPHSSSYTDFTNSDDVPGIPNSTNARDALGDENGMTNTNAIRTKYGSSFSNCQAAYRCYYYNHSTGTYGSTHQGWYLPAAGQLRKLFAELPALNATLTHLGTAAQQFTQNPYWSSSEASYLNAWGIINSGALVDSNKHNSFPYARPVRAF